MVETTKEKTTYRFDVTRGKPGAEGTIVRGEREEEQ